MAGQKARKRAEPNYFLDDPRPLYNKSVTPAQYHTNDVYSSSKAIVFDLGSSTLRAGFSRCPEPLMQLPPYVARLKDPETGIRTFLIGTDALTSSARSTAKPAYKSGLPNNPALMERLLDGTLAGLGLADEPQVNHSFVLTEAPMQPNSARALMMELIFEAYEAPSICFGVDALFSYFWNCNRRGGLSFANRSGCVVSCGYNTTHVLPIVEGRLDAQGVKRINVGGSDMTDQFTRRLQLLNQEHAGVLTTNRCEMLKERVCYVSEDYDNELLKIQTDVDYYNKITKTVKVPTGEGAEKPPLSAEEKEKLKQARSENGRRLSELMKEKRRARKEKGSGKTVLRDYEQFLPTEADRSNARA
ncbi:Actin-related protein [Gracilaria domingensis]|nr:Actin-related protein [Gracilaria domingensis]